MRFIFLTTAITLVLGNYLNIIPEEGPKFDTLLTCCKNIILKYYTEAKKLAYVNMDDEADHLLRGIHSLERVAVNTRKPPETVSRINLGYVIVAADITDFVQHITYLRMEASWNPYARFLIIIKPLEWEQLREIFDIFLDLHVNNVVIVNGSDTAELYTYNPYDEFACGKYYTRIIEFGKCLDVTKDLYPEKVTTGLRNCFFNVSVPHWPPYGVDPSEVNDGTYYPIGTEQYIFNLISEIEHFEYKFNYDYDPESFSTVSSNMNVSGPMVMLARNQTDVMLGGLILIPSRANMFFYIHGHLDNVDEVRLMVKSAVETPAWKNFYLEFSPMVWVSLLLALIFYSLLVVILIRAKDKGHVVMILLDNLLSHGSQIRSRQAVKNVFILWVWFAYLINCFYTTTLMSLTTKPSMCYQISDEEAIKDYRLQPCLSTVMEKFAETGSTNALIRRDDYVGTKDCERFIDSIKTVSQSFHMFTIVIYSVYLFNKQQFYDQYGISPVYSFRKPYTKVIYAMYFNKGFPMFERLHSLAIRIRETGLSDKSLNDHYYNQKIRHHFRAQGFVARFGIPWYPYVIGLCVSSLTFVVELASQSKYKKVQIKPKQKYIWYR